jgi:hypothetical protein
VKISRQVPQESALLVETNTDSKMFRWYEIAPKVAGELQYQGVRKWVSDDGLTFSDPDAALMYFKKRAAQTPNAIEPGVYSMAVNEVVQQTDRVILRLKSGAEVVINFSKS